ncbi:MAG: hypothetical protein ACSLE9_11080 [Burkholderiaceae bacterium]
MAIFRHPDGTYRRYPYTAPAPIPAPQAEQPGDWRPLHGAHPGIQIHRDGKTMRNVAPTPRSY